jgi:hypothetical protein
VLWLDDTFFEDEPLLRLPLLLEPLTSENTLQSTNLPAVALLGPRRSSTLRAMLPGPLAGTTPLWEANTYLWSLATNVLTNVSVYCATPSAMDEVLVSNPDDTPRATVGRQFVATNRFKSFHNFAATDAQLAKEVLCELALRGLNVEHPNKSHLVLISEWDTFYARMLSLTYGAEMAVSQRTTTNRADFIYSYISNTNGAMTLPTNFHSFVYLRGLDGQTIGRSPYPKADTDSRAKSSTTSFEELRKWTPDANKAEGQAQFDYLSRLGDQLDELEDRLEREHGRVKVAVGT